MTLLFAFALDFLILVATVIYSKRGVSKILATVCFLFIEKNIRRKYILLFLKKEIYILIFYQYTVHLYNITYDIENKLIYKAILKQKKILLLL